MGNAVFSQVGPFSICLFLGLPRNVLQSAVPWELLPPAPSPCREHTAWVSVSLPETAPRSWGLLVLSLTTSED